MGVSAGMAVAALGIGVLQVNEQRKQRKQVEDVANQERESIQALQRELTAEATKSPMPVPDDATAKRAERRSITSQMRRRGRQSTILTGGSGTDALGGG